MKTIKSLFLAASLLIAAFFVSCSGDESGPSGEVLVVSHRNSGQFYSIDLTTGEKTEAFTISYDNETLNDTRAFVYHPRERKFFVSQATNSGGYLYAVDASSKVATLINDNDGSDNEGTADVWDAVVNWYVAEDDSLLSIGDFNNDASDGYVKFGTDGGRGIPVYADICCGMGMLYEAGDANITVGSSEGNDNGEVEIVSVDMDGNVTLTNEITNFSGFDEVEDFTNVWLNVKSLAQAKNGDIYGILFSYPEGGTGNSYFVSFDLTENSITYISTLGTGSSNQYNTMAFIPKKTL